MDNNSQRNQAGLESLLIQVSKGTVDIESAMLQLAEFSATKQAAAASDYCLDLERKQRCGFPEAIYACGKKPEMILDAFVKLSQTGNHALATRVNAEQIEHVSSHFPNLIVNHEAKTIRLMVKNNQPKAGKQTSKQALILTAGTTDRAVAEEAAETLRWMEQSPLIIFDVGVAGPQRLLKHVEQMQQADVIIVAAGMEGALPSVVGGWVACPVIAVPTSVGYGTNFGGVSALLSMLNSCAANVCTVNIDAGFKAGYLAGVMMSQR